MACYVSVSANPLVYFNTHTTPSIQCQDQVDFCCRFRTDIFVCLFPHRRAEPKQENPQPKSLLQTVES